MVKWLCGYVVRKTSHYADMWFASTKHLITYPPIHLFLVTYPLIHLFLFTYPLTRLYGQQLNITSDKMEYDKLGLRSTFSGNVKLKVGDTSLSCDEVGVDANKKEINLKNVFFTTCDHENPHYHYYAKNVHLILEKEITAKNVAFYIDNVPLGILPYYYKSLVEKKLKIDFKHGYNRSKGYFSKGLIGYRLSEHFFSKVYLDYYSYKGWGYGLEELYNVDGKMQGAVYGYRIF